MPNGAEPAPAQPTPGTANEWHMRGVVGRSEGAHKRTDPVERLTSAGSWSGGPYAHAVRNGRGPLYLRRLRPPAHPGRADGEGEVLPLDIERWCAAPDSVDTGVLNRCNGPVLDVGCGPGRLTAALAARGTRVLGVDVSPAAVARTRQRGGTALCGSVFDRLPGEGRWSTVLLLDGNVGIGGDPAVLLTRLFSVVAPGSHLLAEANPHDVDEHLTVRIEDAHGRHGRPFPWARLGSHALQRTAEAAGWVLIDRWTAEDRPFVELLRPVFRNHDGQPAVTGGRGRP